MNHPKPATGDDYADAVTRRLEGRPLPNVHRLVADAWNAGYVQATLDRKSKGGIQKAETPTLRLSGKGGHD